MPERCATKNLPRNRKLGRPRLLIVGCGDIGARIVARLASRYRIVAVNSTSARNAALRALGAVPIVADLDQRQSLARLKPFATRLIHLAPPAADGNRDLRTRRLVTAISRAKPSRSVYCSTTGVYGDHGGRRIAETARCRPTTARGQRRLDGEIAMRGTLRATVLRVPGIYGFDRLPLDRLRDRVPVLDAASDVYTSHVHADDLARIAIVALHRRFASRVFNVNDDTELKMGDYFDLVADHFGLPRPPRRSRPEIAREASPMAASFFNDSRRLSNRRLKSELKFRFGFPTVRAALNAAGSRRENGPQSGR